METHRRNWSLAHIFLTESYRYATASVIAPFDYSPMLWALLLGYWVFGELPAPAWL
jgi:drug/metabolite transporter (DMT)-like permease